MHAAVVELDPLADSIRPRSQDDDPRLLGRRDLVLVLEGPVHVWRVGGEFRRAGVDGLEGRADPFRQTPAANLVLAEAPEITKLVVGEAEPFGSCQRLDREPAAL